MRFPPAHGYSSKRNDLPTVLALPPCVSLCWAVHSWHSSKVQGQGRDDAIALKRVEPSKDLASIKNKFQGMFTGMERAKRGPVMARNESQKQRQLNTTDS